MNEVLISEEEKKINPIKEEKMENFTKKLVNLTKDIHLRSNCLSKLFFYWAYKIIRLSNYASLTTESLGILEEENLSKNYYNELEEVWEKKNYIKIKRNALFKAIVRANYVKILLGFILILSANLIEFLQVYLFRILIKMYQPNFKPPFEFLEEYFTKTNVGIVYVLLNLINSFLSNYISFYNNLNGSRANAQLNCIIYKKVLKMDSARFKGKFNEGEIINYIQIDSEKLITAFTYGPWLFANPIGVSVYLFMLFEFMGISFVFGFASLILIILANTFLMNKLKTLTVLYMKAKDERMKITCEALFGLKVLKLNGWDNEVLMRIHQARMIELQKLRKNFNVFTAINTLFFFAPTVMFVCSIGAYQYFNGVMNIEDIFVCINIFTNIYRPITEFPINVSLLLQLFVSMRRVEVFLKEDNVNEYDVIRNDIETNNQGISIKLVNGYYSWGKSDEINDINEQKIKDNLFSDDITCLRVKNEDLNSLGINQVSSFTSKGEIFKPEQLVLKNLNFEIFKGEFVCIIGETGAGKSSLINSILNNMIKIQESNLTTQKLIVNGSISYVSQIPWMINDTIKNNIIFFSEYDQQKYNDVLDICELKHDLLNFPEGDMTEIVERGANLSGGQKSRISIARAVYANNDIFLLDDPISALDPQVGEKIIKNVILRQIKMKTRVLVTHALQFLNYADKIIYMEGGEIKFIGSYDRIKQQEFFISMNSSIGVRKTLVENSKERERFSLDLRYNSSSLSNHSLGLCSYVDRTSLVKRTDSILEELKFQEPFESDDDILKVLINKQTLRTPNDEFNQKGAVSRDIYYSYFKYTGVCCFILFASFTFLANGLKAFSDIWLSNWTQNQTREDNMFYFYVYVGLGFFTGLFYFLQNFTVTRCILNLSKRLHHEMVEKLVHAPINLFHDTVPIGRMLNRVSFNLNNLDDNFAVTLVNLLTSSCFIFLNSIAICSYVEIYSLAFLPPILIFGYLLFRFCVNANSDLSRLESVSRTPIINSLTETLSGISSIRAYNTSKLFMENFHEKVDVKYKVKLFLSGTLRWFCLTMSYFPILFLISNIVFAIVFEDFYTPQKIGIMLSYSLFVQISFYTLNYNLIRFENLLVNMEKCLEITKIPSELPRKMEIDEKLNESKWPEFGKIEFVNYSVRYRPDTDLVLKNLNFKIQPNEKIGVVGRTGSGKSTICLSLFRILEATQGKILIDDVDISEIGLDKLRRSLTIIPQDPILMSESLKYNIDPLNIYKEHEIKNILKMIGWVSSENDDEVDLSKNISENGNNMSIGEKQIICITRAILNKSRIVVMDEATANIDIKTEQIIQKAIDKFFVNKTVITIAHRIKTIINYDKILVLDEGRIIEYESPNILKNRRNSIFYNLLKNANL